MSGSTTGSSTGDETTSDVSLNDLSVNHNNALFAGAVADSRNDATADIDIDISLPEEMAIEDDDNKPKPKEDSMYLLADSNDYRKVMGETENLWNKAITTLTKGKRTNTGSPAINSSTYDEPSGVKEEGTATAAGEVGVGDAKPKRSAYDFSLITLDGDINGGEAPTPDGKPRKSSQIVPSSDCWSIDGESAILWGDDPEKAYFEYMLEKEAETRALEGKDQDDSLMAESVRLELLHSTKYGDGNSSLEDDVTLGHGSKALGWEPSTAAGVQLSTLTPSHNPSGSQEQLRVGKDGQLIIPNVIYVQDGTDPNPEVQSRVWNNSSADNRNMTGITTLSKPHPNGTVPEQPRRSPSSQRQGVKSKAAAKQLSEGAEGEAVDMRQKTGWSANRLLIGIALCLMILTVGLVAGLIIYRNHYADDGADTTNTDVSSANLDQNGNPITLSPSVLPSPAPSPFPSPKLRPTNVRPHVGWISKPTRTPSVAPTWMPTQTPTWFPTGAPSFKPVTVPPTFDPSVSPTEKPSSSPTDQLSSFPSDQPSTTPTFEPSLASSSPTDQLSSFPSDQPSTMPTFEPSLAATPDSDAPSFVPTLSIVPTNITTPFPSLMPTAISGAGQNDSAPVNSDNAQPESTTNSTILIITPAPDSTNIWTSRPVMAPSASPTKRPSRSTKKPTRNPTKAPGLGVIATVAPRPTISPPTASPTAMPRPSRLPTIIRPPTKKPSASPSGRPTERPTEQQATQKPTPTPSQATQKPTPTPSQIPTSVPTTTGPTTGLPVPFYATIDRVQDFLMELSPMSARALSDQTSSQYVAMVWLANWMATIPPDELGIVTKKRLVQRWALAVLFLELNGPFWFIGADDWMGEGDSCDWLSNNNQGSCNIDNLVETLDLSDNNLRGTLPSEVSLLSDALSRLEMDRNLIAGSLPQQLGTMRQLVTLDFTRCELSGTIPTNLGNLQNLAILGLGRNNFVGTIPSEVGNMTSLVYLSLERNEFGGAIPTGIIALTQLEYIALDWNALTGEVPSNLYQLSSLRTLILARNSLRGQIPNEFCQRPMDFLAADCDEVSCACCDLCCVNGQGCAST